MQWTCSIPNGGSAATRYKERCYIFKDAPMFESNITLISKREVTDVHNHIQVETVVIMSTNSSSTT